MPFVDPPPVDLSASTAPAIANAVPGGGGRRSVDPRETRAFRLFRTALPVSVARRLLFRRTYGRRLPLRRPQTFAEKINWRIVRDRRPLLSWACDKEAVKAFVAAAHPDVVVPATLWSGVDLGELAGRELPERWVCKPNHRTGLVHLGRGTTVEVAELRRVTRGWLAEEQSDQFGEWAYAGARRLLLVEEWLDDAARAGSTGTVFDSAPQAVIAADVVPVDYKFYVYDGVVRYVSEFTGRFVNIQERIYTPAWEPTDLRFMSPPGPVHSPPAALGRMLEVAAALGKGFDFVRVDLYEVRGLVGFGELTVYPGSGLFPAARPSDDAALGVCWTLPALDRHGLEHSPTDSSGHRRWRRPSR